MSRVSVGNHAQNHEEQMPINNASEILRPHNLKETHAIALGTLVEVDLDYSDHHGVRAFVVAHTRDCDGSPMYALGMSETLSYCQHDPSLNGGA